VLACFAGLFDKGDELVASSQALRQWAHQQVSGASGAKTQARRDPPCAAFAIFLVLGLPGLTERTLFAHSFRERTEQLCAPWGERGPFSCGGLIWANKTGFAWR